MMKATLNRGGLLAEYSAAVSKLGDQHRWGTGKTIVKTISLMNESD